ncbi:MAG: hypothetical protein L6R38_006369 [Xanthoria sp. 2 TBL-2021]|nr:MAG: hypothetical protein L6R38_006369 [Xanthoria sp. 2 TBL-2021]
MNCNDGRFGGVTEAEIDAANQKIFDAYIGIGDIYFASNDLPKTFPSGECTIAIRHDQASVEGSVPAGEILHAVDQIKDECIEPHITQAGGRGWGGDVAGITGADGTFMVPIYQYPEDGTVGSPGTVASDPLGSPAGGSAGSSGGFETYGTSRKHRKFRS